MLEVKMDAVILARIQFALTIGFHFLFPAMTLGTGLIILISETIYIIKKDEDYKRITDFLARLLGVIFVVGAASGITMEFSFGNNWSQYARAVGDIFGPILAVEGVVAFFLESVFIGVLVFGRGRVSKGLYWISALLVFLGSHLSGFWIIVANSWMQTPAGFDPAIYAQTGKIVLSDFGAAVFNPSTLPRFMHTIMASWMTCSIMVTGIGAYYVLIGKFGDTAKKMLKFGIILFAITPLLQLVTGHIHAVQVLNTQPVKGAALEGLFETKSGVPIYGAGWVDVNNKKTTGIAIPDGLSFLYNFHLDSTIKGLNEFPKENWPNVNFIFQTYHLMVAIGILSIGVGLFGAWLLYRKKLYETKWFLFLLPFMIPLPHIAHESGWISAEVGRQPWIIYNMMRTHDAASVVVGAGQILFSLIMFAAIYTMLAVIFLSVAMKIIKKGFDSPAAEAKI
jgi:cytochrome d ubiquinol oxidase subunit I